MFDLSDINKKNICIMGLMGSGKSIIGKSLSKYLNLKFYDTDTEIEIETRKSINSIFKDEGELYFRDIEEKICIDLFTLSPSTCHWCQKCKVFVFSIHSHSQNAKNGDLKIIMSYYIIQSTIICFL